MAKPEKNLHSDVRQFLDIIALLPTLPYTADMLSGADSRLNESLDWTMSSSDNGQ